MKRGFLQRFHPRRTIRSEDGSATVEFVVLFPVLFAIFLTSVDFSMMMLRQVFLDRAVDIAVRDIRLGRVPENGFDMLRERICANTALTPDCLSTITIEMRPVTPGQLASMERTATCVNRAENITPMLDFRPGSGGQELMVVRVCTVSNPIIVASGLIFGGPRSETDDFMSVSTAVFVNEPV